MLPGVLSVEDDEDGRLSPVRLRRISRPRIDQPLDEVLGGSFSRPRRVAESNQVGECVITKAAADLLSVASDAVRTVQRVWVLHGSVTVPAELAARALGENLFVRRHP